LTLHGKLKLKRAYFHCSKCKKGEFPHDKILGLMPARVSPVVAEKICLVSSLDPFIKASDILHRLSGIKVSATCMEDISEKIGFLISETDRKQAAINIEQLEPCTEKPERLYVQADGAMVNTVEGWRENKLGMVFSEADIKRSGKGEKERISILKKNFVTSLFEGVTTFKNLLKLIAHRAGASSAREVILITDGAVWLMNMGKEFLELFPNTVHILDWFHVTENLWKCSKALFGENNKKGRLWVERYKQMIWDGDITEALAKLLQEANDSKSQTPLRELYGYFDFRKAEMDYANFRKQGYYIGSGSIESANSYAIQDRLKKSGMKWSVKGANAIAHLRIKYLSDNWDYLWSKGSPIFAAAG
jgi:hypothetical protein